MSTHFIYHIAVSLSLLLSFVSSSASEVEQDPKVTLKVYAVGQGNCASLEVRDAATKKSEFMLLDIGSTSFAAEAAYRQHHQVQSSHSPQESTTTTNRPTADVSTPTKPASKVTVPISTKKSPNWDETQEDKNVIAELKETERDQFIKKMRKMLMQDQSSEQQKKTKQKKVPPISVKTVVVTHPDTDHYGWLMNLFSQPEDKIEFLIFGGLPSHYYSQPEDQQKFKGWLSLRLATHSKIFFPAIQYAALAPQDKANPLQEILLKEKKEEFAPTFSLVHCLLQG
ncbi:hypothetical protein IM40_03225 [Candidatus Paracaedimonas acanthamoebae]|nr:hypothetical protein IM40_03225 [Candidatus Paracaedimonas acanthamoebae]